VSVRSLSVESNAPEDFLVDGRVLRTTPPLESTTKINKTVKTWDVMASRGTYCRMRLPCLAHVVSHHFSTDGESQIFCTHSCNARCVYRDVMVHVYRRYGKVQ
jgi:hypothetical protein